MKKITNNELEVITYGFFIDPRRITQPTPQNRYWWRIKPDGGVWGSPVESEYGWKDWCTMEDYNTESLSIYTKWRIKNPSRLIKIDCMEDLLSVYEKYPYITPENPNKESLDFHAMMKDGWSGVWLTQEGEMDTRENFGYPEDNWAIQRINLYGWDCESIVCWDPEEVVVIEKGRL